MYQQVFRDILIKFWSKLHAFVKRFRDNIFIYIEGLGQARFEVILWFLDILPKKDFFANLIKCWFHKKKFRFLRHIILAQAAKIEDKKIKMVQD